MQLEKYPLVIIEWEDSRGVQAHWTELDDLDEGICIIESVGWIIVDKPEYIIILPHSCGDPPQGCGSMTIPRKVISSIKKLKIGE